MSPPSTNGAGPEQGELIYAPEPSWAPAGVALGLGSAAVGVFFQWIFVVIGAIFVAAALRSWIRDASDQFVRLPRRQRVTAAVLPAVPLRAPRS